MTSSIEASESLEAWDLRQTLNQVNEPPKRDPNTFDIGNGFSFERKVDYVGNVYAVTDYVIFHNDNYQCSFKSSQYPECCGISILHRFQSIDEFADGFTEALNQFFRNTEGCWKPNIQFVAVKSVIYDEEYDEDDDEYYDKPVGIEDNYDYHNLIVELIKVLKPTLLSSFINKNSDNQCDVYQAVNPFRE